MLKNSQSVVISLLIIAFTAVNSYAVMSYLDNGTIKIGIDTSRGATITYLSQSGSSRNVINYADLGREVQQSYYSGPIPFMGGYYNGSDWGWNPVAAGDTNNNRSTVLEYSNNGTTIYTRIIPKQWALDDVDSECTMEKWITISGNIVHVQCQLVNTRTDGTTQYEARHQELPAVYTTADLYRQFAYTGSSPFTSGGLTQITNSGPPWEYINATENWIANVDGSNWGLGVFTPGAQHTVMGFYGSHDTSPPGNPTSSSTGYIAPLRSEILDYNITYNYEFYLILDSLTNIRSYVYSHQPNKNPDYIFEDDRQGWYYRSGLEDAGFPISGYIRVLTEASDPYMFSQHSLWQASAVPKLYVNARYNTTNTNAKFYWSKFSSPGFPEAQSKSFTIIADNQWHVYEVNLSTDSDYTGAIKQLRFDPVSDGGSGQYVDIASITSYAPVSAPVIQEVSPDPDTNAYAGTEYTKQLQLSQGSTPITWSVEQGPAELQVDSSGYVYNWTPVGCDVGSSVTIEIQALNSHGSDTETWQVEPKEYYLADSSIDLLDLAQMSDEWLLTGTGLTTDLDCSSDVDFLDYAILADEWDSGVQPPDLVISELSPSSYQVVYDALNAGQLLYVDRTVEYASVPFSYQVKTFIKTANDDKHSSGSSFMSFEINRDASVYVAHDDRLATKPSWLSSFTDTGDDLVDNSGESVHLSLYKKDFSTNDTVTLGGNEGGGQPNCSMYTVVVVEK
jgi:hypothetical protein